MARAPEQFGARACPPPPFQQGLGLWECGSRALLPPAGPGGQGGRAGPRGSCCAGSHSPEPKVSQRSMPLGLSFPSCTRITARRAFWGPNGVTCVGGAAGDAGGDRPCRCGGPTCRAEPVFCTSRCGRLLTKTRGGKCICSFALGGCSFSQQTFKVGPCVGLGTWWWGGACWCCMQEPLSRGGGGGGGEGRGPVWHSVPGQTERHQLPPPRRQAAAFLWPRVSRAEKIALVSVVSGRGLPGPQRGGAVGSGPGGGIRNTRRPGLSGSGLRGVLSGVRGRHERPRARPPPPPVLDQPQMAPRGADGPGGWPDVSPREPHAPGAEQVEPWGDSSRNPQALTAAGSPAVERARGRQAPGAPVAPGGPHPAERKEPHRVRTRAVGEGTAGRRTRSSGLGTGEVNGSEAGANEKGASGGRSVHVRGQRSLPKAAAAAGPNSGASGRHRLAVPRIRRGGPQPGSGGRREGQGGSAPASPWSSACKDPRDDLGPSGQCRTLAHPQNPLTPAVPRTPRWVPRGCPARATPQTYPQGPVGLRTGPHRTPSVCVYYASRKKKEKWPKRQAAAGSVLGRGGLGPLHRGPVWPARTQLPGPEADGSPGEGRDHVCAGQDDGLDCGPL